MSSNTMKFKEALLTTNYNQNSYELIRDFIMENFLYNKGKCKVFLTTTNEKIFVIKHKFEINFNNKSSPISIFLLLYIPLDFPNKIPKLFFIKTDNVFISPYYIEEGFVDETTMEIYYNMFPNLSYIPFENRISELFDKVKMEFSKFFPLYQDKKRQNDYKGLCQFNVNNSNPINFIEEIRYFNDLDDERKIKNDVDKKLEENNFNENISKNKDFFTTDSEIRNLKNELDLKNNEISNLKNQIKNQSEETSDLKIMVQKLKKTIEENNKEIENLKRKIQEVNNEKNSKIQFDSNEIQINDILNQKDNEIINVEKKINELEAIANDKKNNNSNFINDNKDLQEIYEKLDEKEKKIEYLNNQLIGSIKYDELKEDDELIAVNFISGDQRKNFPVVCKSSSLFAEVENILYKKYPEYGENSEKSNLFLANGNKIERIKTMAQNGFCGYNITLMKNNN